MNYPPGHPLSPFNRDPHQIHFPEDGNNFQLDRDRAAKAFGMHDNVGGLQDAWSLISRGKTLGKSALLKFDATLAGEGVVAITPREILRLEPRGAGAQADQLSTQFCVTLAAPQVLPGTALANLPMDPSTAAGGFMDNIQLAQTPNNQGGSAVTGAAALDWVFGNPIAIVQWGSGSVINRVEADLLNGLCLNLVGSWLSVTATVEGAGAYTLTSGGYLISACVGPGYPKTNNAQRTVFIGEIANGFQSSIFCVPRFAKNVRLIGGDPSSLGNVPSLMAGTVTFFRSQTGGPIADFYQTGNTAQPFPIPGGAQYFMVTGGYAQAAGGAAPFYEALFELSV